MCHQLNYLVQQQQQQQQHVFPIYILQAALTACQNGGAGIMDGSNGDGFSSGSDGAATGQESVLHVTIENMVYPVTLETLSIIFKKYGPVQKILTFTKNNKFQVCSADNFGVRCLRQSLAS